MDTLFQTKDLSLESQWRSLILFGKNSATYKFAFAKTLLELIDAETTSIKLSDLAVPFASYIVERLKQNDKQGNSHSSKYLDSCREYINGKTSLNELHRDTERLGFVNVIDAFQNVNGGVIPNQFYKKNYLEGRKEIIITDNLFKLRETVQYTNLNQEVEARWKLVETAWSLDINRNLLQVHYDQQDSLLYIQDNFMKRLNITSVRDALNGYQKGKCFYSFSDISINQSVSERICAVDHFLPHVHKRHHHSEGANINGVWNLVLADSEVNNDKRARIPERRFLERLFNRNEFYIESKHPLAETIINQTGTTRQQRIHFLEKQYNLAVELGIHNWKPKYELPGSF
jgi:hypothetical protein